MTILIAGAGDLGTEVGLRFVAQGEHVVAVRRRADLLPAALDSVSLDLRSDRLVVPPDTTVIVVALTAGERSPEAYRATYVDGLAAVLDAVDASEADPRILLVSSTAVYGVDDGSEVTEATEALPSTPTAEVLLEAEVLLNRRAAHPVVVRVGGIYGPGREFLIDQVRSGASSVPEASPFTNRIHRDDIAAALVHLAGLEAAPPLVLAVDDEPARLGDVFRFLAAELQVAPPDETRKELRGAGDKRISNALLRSTGFRFVYPTFREGYRAVLAGEGIRHP
ncbi:nucleoside-diphosphate-sugar epimerase [Frondihabitans sp. PhB188]|uniref:NAD-dependent epimerase/dehydratase family protein n=1 Tax=Frondihabitans sp. PhB188 TaxID=2485200 RepID=UPI000F4A6E49|nr:NAD-dependent epimerase/dehydratase family protein [Frondihabitans sp. PhB188]ROQ38480.1 nucleoside-diphosphate-sugar epimerase [Frondihabitans sp. PhB188]